MNKRGQKPVRNEVIAGGSPTSFDIQPMKFKSRREAKDWCASHYPGSHVTEIGADRSPRIVVAAPLSLRGVQEDTKHGQAISRLVRPPSSPEIRSEIVTQLSSRIEGVRVYFQVKYLIVWIISCPLAKLPAIAVAASAINIGLTKVALLNAAVRAGLARPYAPGSPWRHPQCHVLRIGWPRSRTTGGREWVSMRQKGRQPCQHDRRPPTALSH